MLALHVVASSWLSPGHATLQEHLALLRQLVLAFPAHYAELLVLTGGPGRFIWSGRSALL